jgi:hypothetical protein
MLPAKPAILLQFDPPRVVPAVLLRCIIPVLAVAARQRDDWTNVFLGHVVLG